MAPLLPLQIGVIVVLGLLLALAAPAALQPATTGSDLVVRDTTPASGERLPSRPLRLSADVVGQRDLQRAELRLNGEPMPATIQRLDPRHWRVSYQFAPPAGGTDGRVTEQHAQIIARDVHGRQRAYGWRFSIDPTLSAPVIISLQPPDNGYAPAGGARIGAVVQGDAAIDAVTLQIDGLPYPVVLESGQGTRVTAMARVDLKPGAYRAMLTATDKEGDRAISRWRFVVPDPRELLAFEQTGRAIGGGFRRFWQERGGLPIFGLPISDEISEQGRTVQYFERARFEYQPSRDGLLSEVQLGLVGAELRRPDPARPAPAGDDVRFFPETGQAISGPFRQFFEEKGGIGLFGLPISAETREGNRMVQYFERARFERALTGSTAVSLGHVGREVYERRYPPSAPTPAPVAAPRP